AAAAQASCRALLAGLEERLSAMSSGSSGSSGASGVTNLYVVPSAELLALYPVEPLHDPYADQIGHIPYSPAGFAALGTLVARKVHALLSPPAKVIVLDCDQTLWRGVCGEDGPAGVVLDEPRRFLQEFVLAQRQEGMLLCLCSKNEEEDVWSTFDQRPDFPLERGHLTAWKINWSAKSENLRSLSAELCLGLDGFVLIDDNPVECAEVRASCPQVMVLELPADEREIPRVLRHFWAFDRLRTTVEDRERPELYRQSLERERLRERAGSFEEFLAGLGLVVDILPPAPDKLERVAQLTQRTNQFNTSTIRRTAGEIQRLLAEDALECRTVLVRDRFGDYGLVGVVLFAARSAVLEIDTFLLSCRVLGRGVEHSVVSALAREAADRGLWHIEFKARPTAKNSPALSFLRGLPESLGQAAEDGELRFRLPAVPVAMAHASVTPQADGAAVEAVPGSVAGTARDASLLLRIATELRDPLAVRRRIAASRGRTRRSTRGYVPPRGAAEERLCTILAELLGIERIGAEDSFFELGAHSLVAAQAVSRIREAFGVELAMRAFYEASTVAGLAAEIERRRLPAGAAERPAIASFRENRSSPPPLSFAQERFWAGRQLEALTVASTIPVLWRFEGKLDLACLRQALQEVVDRHEALRTSFREGTERPVQVVHPTIPVRFPVVDLERMAPAGRMEEVRRWSALDGRSQFDYERGPLFRLTLFQLSPRESVLLFTVHHIAFDGWSEPILSRELLTVYEALRAGRPSPLPPLAVQYQDFARWQRNRVAGEALTRLMAFWREHLRGASPLDLAAGRPRPARRTFEAGFEAFTVPEELERSLDRFAAEHRVTLFMILLAAFKALLHRETGRDDVVVTCLFANRSQSEMEDLIGNFYAGLPLRTRLSGAPTFRTLLGRVREVTLAAHEHPDILYESAMEGMSFLEPGDRGGLATFRILFQLTKLPPSGQAVSGLEVVRLPFDTGKIRQDLSLFLAQSDWLGGRFKYNLDVLDRERVERMRDRFLQILAAAVVDPDRPLAELPADEIPPGQGPAMTPARRRKFESIVKEPCAGSPGAGCPAEGLSPSRGNEDAL
ncbi:MAG TPA: HAD-IIIC family phosphatase, partial [Thermoanaerobaculia bacterium]|nr:HAD-IIIC family phosphatase [Thermoanaerobaculia bacterium]